MNADERRWFFCKNAMPCGQGRDRGQEKTEVGGWKKAER